MGSAPDLRPMIKEVWARALKWRGRELGPDEIVTFDTEEHGDGIRLTAWWMKGYGRDDPKRHASRTVYLSGFLNRGEIVDRFIDLTQSMALELFPRSTGRWRLFSRRPCKA